MGEFGWPSGVLFFRVDNPPLADLTAPNARHELLAGIGVMHPDGLPGIALDQLFGRKKICIWLRRGLGELYDWHVTIILSLVGLKPSRSCPYCLRHIVPR